MSSLELIRNGEQYIQSTLKLIHSCEKYIWLQSYIFEVDSVTQEIINALIHKSHIGVQIYILLDAFGSRSFPNSVIQKLEAAGINIQFFANSLAHGPIGRRLHSKVLITDGSQALVGGINYAKRFNKPDHTPPWIDFALEMNQINMTRLIQSVYPLYQKYFKLSSVKPFINSELEIIEFDYEVKINDWMHLKNEIYQTYKKTIHHSKNEIIILAPYFLPNRKFLKTLRQARRRGVQIKLIFGEESDYKLERLASKYLYPWYLNNGFKLYEFQGAIIHGKVAIFDSKTVSIGSYNHNFLSHLHNHELNIFLKDPHICRQTQNALDEIIQGSIFISDELWKNSSVISQRLKIYLSYLFSTILSGLFTFFLQRRTHARSKIKNFTSD